MCKCWAEDILSAPGRIINRNGKLIHRDEKSICFYAAFLLGHSIELLMVLQFACHRIN